MAGHKIVDEWRDITIVCSCGWRDAGRTRKEVYGAWRKHRDEAHAATAAASGRGDPAGKGAD